MRNTITAQDIVFAGAAAAVVLGLSYLLAGRRIQAPPASSALPQTFVASRLIPAVFSLFAIFGVFTSLALATALVTIPTEEIGPLGFRLFIGVFAFLIGTLSVFGVRFFGLCAIWPDQLSLTDDGISARLRGCNKHWAWGDITDVRVQFPGTRYERLQLVLRDPDPDQVRRLGRFPWKKSSDARVISLDDFWRPTALLTSGDMAVRDAIQAIIASRRQTQTRG